jgi:hypothetical protein
MLNLRQMHPKFHSLALKMRNSMLIPMAYPLGVPSEGKSQKKYIEKLIKIQIMK